MEYGKLVYAEKLKNVKVFLLQKKWLRKRKCCLKISAGLLAEEESDKSSSSQRNGQPQEVVRPRLFRVHSRGQAQMALHWRGCYGRGWFYDHQGLFISWESTIDPLAKLRELFSSHWLLGLAYPRETSGCAGWSQRIITMCFTSYITEASNPQDMSALGQKKKHHINYKKL